MFFSQNLSEPLSILIDRVCFLINRNCFLKNLREPLSVSINRNWFSINRKSWIRFFKKLSLTCSNSLFKSFSNFSFSLRLGQAHSSNFCRFPPKFLQGFPLSKPVSPFYHSFCIYFHVFMHKFMHFVGIFGPIQIWGFWWFKSSFLKLIIGFCSYKVINMIYDVEFDQFSVLWEIENSRACIYPFWGFYSNWF